MAAFASPALLGQTAPMRWPDFGPMAATYARDATVQRDAAEVLMGLLQVGPREDVLDLGCGPGHLTARLRALTSGRVEGVDPSPDMIAEARRRHPAIHYEVTAAEELAREAEFDAVFCNSALHWFRDPARALCRARAALRPGGRVAIQAPARRRYCPNFVEAMARVAADPQTRDTFARFRSPWFFLESAEEYAALAERCGLDVRLARIDATRSRLDAEGAMRVFESAAVAGYLGPQCYDVPVAPAYARHVRHIVRDALARQAAEDGAIEMVIHRAFLVAARR